MPHGPHAGQSDLLKLRVSQGLLTLQTDAKLLTLHRTRRVTGNPCGTGYRTNVLRVIYIEVSMWPRFRLHYVPSNFSMCYQFSSGKIIKSDSVPLHSVFLWNFENKLVRF